MDCLCFLRGLQLHVREDTVNCYGVHVFLYIFLCWHFLGMHAFSLPGPPNLHAHVLAESACPTVIASAAITLTTVCPFFLYLSGTGYMQYIVMAVYVGSLCGPNVA